ARNGMASAEGQLRDAICAQLPGLEPEVCTQIVDWLVGEEVGWSFTNAYPLRRGTLEAIITAHFRARVHAQVYVAGRSAGGWHIMLIEADRDKRQQDDRPFRRTPRGTWLRSEQEYHKLQERHVLPV